MSGFLGMQSLDSKVHGTFVANGVDAVVYKDPPSGPPGIARKLFHKHEAFVRERSVYKRLESVPELSGRIPILKGDVDEWEENKPYCEFYLDLEFISGKRLGDAVDELTSVEQLNSIKEEWAKILQIMEENGVKHGDAHQENVMLRESFLSEAVNPVRMLQRGELVVIDFACAVVDLEVGELSETSKTVLGINPVWFYNRRKEIEARAEHR